MPGAPGQQNLQAALASQAAPANPRTPSDRTDPREETLIDQQRIRRALEVAADHRPDESDPLRRLYGMMNAAITRLRDGTQIEDVIDALALALFSMVSPQTRQALALQISPPNAQGGTGMPGGSTPGAGPGQSAGAPPIGPGMPVSPGPPGQ